jgi:hypothetical protein
MVLAWLGYIYVGGDLEWLPVPQIPTHAGFTLTCPAFTSGMGISSKRRSCLPWKRSAFMVPLPSGGGWNVSEDVIVTATSC